MSKIPLPQTENNCDQMRNDRKYLGTYYQLRKYDLEKALASNKSKILCSNKTNKKIKKRRLIHVGKRNVWEICYILRNISNK